VILISPIEIATTPSLQNFGLWISLAVNHSKKRAAGRNALQRSAQRGNTRRMRKVWLDLNSSAYITRQR
jgi:hypothetical protein